MGELPVKVRIQRAHATAPAWILSFAVACAVIWFAAHSILSTPRVTKAVIAAPERVTREITLDGEACSFVRLGAYASPAEARLSASRLVPRGAAGYLYADGAEVSVLGNAYASEENAEKAVKALKAEDISADILTLPAETLILRLTATETQISAFLTGWNALGNAIGVLNDVARRLDAGEIDASAARTQALVAAYDMQVTLNAFSAYAPDSGDAVLSSFVALCTRAVSNLRTLTAGSETGLYLSSQVRYALIDCILARREFLRDPG